MIITKDILNKKVPEEMFPTRLDSAMNLYCTIETKDYQGLILYNVNPTTWNCLYPFFELNHKFTIDNYNFSSHDLTFKELISEYKNTYQEIHERKNNYTKEKRTEILLEEYLKTFDLKSAKIKDELEPYYELKFSKSKNVWTLYYFENYVVSEIDNLDILLNQQKYSQYFMTLDKNISQINGIEVVSNVPYLLESKSNLEKLHKNKIVETSENYIIIHGSFGSKDGNWFPWLKKELENQHKKVVVPQMPIGVGIQNFDSWSKVLDNLIIGENTTIIAHSIAPIFICKYLMMKKRKVKKLIFVCGFNQYLGIDPDFDAVNESMFLDNYEEIKKYCNNIACYYSNNDPYVEFQKEKEFADTISNRQYIIENAGHINEESGYTEFREILKEIE